VKAGDEYQKILSALKRKNKGVTTADICAATALPLSTVRELMPKAADEYGGRLQVTQSGEILYAFPQGFTSRYRGAGAAIKRFAGVFSAAARAVLVFLFKAWIMLMLTGYFVLFLGLALASVVLQVAVQSKSSERSRGGVLVGPNLFSLLLRFWLYSELTRPRYGGSRSGQAKPKRPLHKAIFSFVFGVANPNRDWDERKDKSLIAYIQSNRGVISLAEYMAFSGENSLDAADSILAFCVRFGGSPEVTEEGSIVYRFDELLLRADSQKFAELSPPVKRIKPFSANTKKMNVWFIVINAVNLLFGSYFLYNSFAAGLLTPETFGQASYLYGFTYVLLDAIGLGNPVSIIKTALGLVPLVFSLFFWLIPAARHFLEVKENENVKKGNFKRFAFNSIWSSPLNIKESRFSPSADVCRPRDITAATDRVIKEIGALSMPEVIMGQDGEALYSFNELEREKQALERYRASIDPGSSSLGKTVFDTGA
jgi:hypothetical protein